MTFTLAIMFVLLESSLLGYVNHQETIIYHELAHAKEAIKQGFRVLIVVADRLTYRTNNDIEVFYIPRKVLKEILGVASYGVCYHDADVTDYDNEQREITWSGMIYSMRVCAVVYLCNMLFLMGVCFLANVIAWIPYFILVNLIMCLVLEGSYCIPSKKQLRRFKELCITYEPSSGCKISYAMSDATKYWFHDEYLTIIKNYATKDMFYNFDELRGKLMECI